MKKGQIERDVPTPDLADKYEFGKFAIGDSRLYEAENIPEALSLYGILKVYAYTWPKRHGKDWKFMTRKIGNGIRIWRVL